MSSRSFRACKLSFVLTDVFNNSQSMFLHTIFPRASHQLCDRSLSSTIDRLLFPKRALTAWCGCRCASTPFTTYNFEIIHLIPYITTDYELWTCSLFHHPSKSLVFWRYGWFCLRNLGWCMYTVFRQWFSHMPPVWIRHLTHAFMPFTVWPDVLPSAV